MSCSSGLLAIANQYRANETHHNFAVMTIEDSRRTQRPYRYGMILLCCGALINWLGLTENYAEPVRYVGIACILGGALLICSAMCCWLHVPNRTANGSETVDEPIHVITIDNSDIVAEKPPAYETVTSAPPSYDDAIKLNPAIFFDSNVAGGSNTINYELAGGSGLNQTTEASVISYINSENSISSNSTISSDGNYRSARHSDDDRSSQR